MSNKLPVSYDRNLARLVDVCLGEGVSDEVRKKIPQIINGQEDLPEGLSANVVFEINWMKGILERLKIPLATFGVAFEDLLGKTLYGEIGFMPEAWKGNKELEIRYSLLLEVIESNPEWWNKYRSKITLGNDGIYFIDLGISLELYDETDENSFKILNEDFGEFFENNIPTTGELRKIWDFIASAGEENIDKLREFLGLKPEKYCSSSKAGYLTKGFAYYNSFNDGNYSYSPETDEHNVRIIVRY